MGSSNRKTRHAWPSTNEIRVKLETTYGEQPADGVAILREDVPTITTVAAGPVVAERSIVIEARITCPCCDKPIHIRIHAPAADDFTEG